MNLFLLLIPLGAAICFAGFCTDTSNIPCHDSERQALLSFKYDLTDPSHRLASWVEGGSCCDWDGVVCHNLTGHVRELHLRNPISFVYYFEDAKGNQAYERMAIGGKINTSLLGLRHLRYLDLSNNDFGGIQVPKFFGSIWSLRYLNLSAAGFGGEIPYQLGNLTKLRYLDIGHESRYKSYTGNLQWLSGLSMLQYLDLSNVNLQKASDRLQGTIALPFLEELHLTECGLSHIPLLSQVNFSNLVILDLSHNHISGSSFSMTWSFSLDSLVILDLSFNSFNDPIPSCLENLTSLKYLDLSHCGLQSTLPSWLYKFSKLEKLMFYRNELQGMISDNIANLIYLNQLDLSRNDNLHGKIPTSLRTMCNLQWVDLSDLKLEQKVSEALNAFVGCASNSLQYLSLSRCELFSPLLDELEQFQNLKHLYLATNLISGPIPESLGSLKSLKTLVLSNNQLNGTLPQSLEQLNHLQYLFLGQNLFHGLVPDSIGSLTSLIQLDLSENQLSGILPVTFGQLIKLVHFDVGHNFLECVLSEGFFVNLTRLQVICASQNSITLKVSPNWIPPFQLTGLSISSWNLGPKFPKWLSSQNLLFILDISNTSIQDTIPDWFWNMSSQFIYMNLSHNQLYGQVFDKITMSDSAVVRGVDFGVVADLNSNCFTGPLPRLSFGINELDLSHNSFSGHMSRLFCDEINETMKSEFLHLGNNRLSGEIPNCWNSWPFIFSLELQNNNLVGNLPSSLGSLSQLQYLHLRNNTLSGVLPSSLQNCTDLIALDLGENKLGGSLPRWIGRKLFDLRILSLRSNDFDGYIPNEMCNLTFLIILDLAHNNLSGTIPKCFSNLSAMANLSSFEFLSKRHRNICTDWAGHGHPKCAPPRYDEIAILVTKTLVLEYGNNLHLMTAVDLSSNSLSGWIPMEITNFISLISLNLSRNCLTGKIPENVGNMKSLESLDLSFNQITGEIPQSMAQMTFLGILNFSYNNLRGRIPTSTQLQSFDASSFMGNNLCGPPISNNCSTTNGSIPREQIEGKNHQRFNEFYVSMSLGFVVGLGVVVVPLLYCSSW